MSERIHPTLTRRTLIATMAGGALAVPTTASAQSDESGSYSVQQGDRCIPITPLRGDQPADEFYDWNEVETLYSSEGTTDLQRNDTSILFLYEDPDGTVSLVIVHEKLDGENDGGSVSFEIRGLPSGGSWIVKDDFYDDPSNHDRWDVGGSVDRIDWTWTGGRTDGGVFSPIGDDPDIRIDPMFNEEAALFEQYYDGYVRNFQVLSGDLQNPERHSLALDETVTIRGGACEQQPKPEKPSMPSDTVSPIEISLPNTVNAGSNGFMMVEIRSTGDFDVGDLNLDTLRLDGSSPIRVQKVPGRKGVIHIFFRVPSMNFDGAGTTRMKLSARGSNGEKVVGSDVVRVVHGDQNDDGTNGDGSDDDGNTQKRSQKRRSEHNGNQKQDNDNPGNGEPGNDNPGNGNGVGQNDAMDAVEDQTEDDGNDALDLLEDIQDDEDEDDDEDD